MEDENIKSEGVENIVTNLSEFIGPNTILENFDEIIEHLTYLKELLNEDIKAI